MCSRAAQLGLLALAALAPRAAGAERSWTLEPFGVLIGGLSYEAILPTQVVNAQAPAYDPQSALTTVALSRFGVRGRLTRGFSYESCFEANAGFASRGMSVWEGEAALQVMQQVLRFERWGLRLDAGHVLDESSVDFFAVHVADLLLRDPYTINMVRTSGLNRGYGAYASYELVRGLRVGFTANAANPAANTAIIMAGGSFNPFGRFYLSILQKTRQDPSLVPADNFHFVLLSPSLSFEHRYLQAQASAQVFWINTDTGGQRDDQIRGVNLRAGLRARLWRDRVTPFLNFSRVVNSVVDPRDASGSTRTIEGEEWRGMTLGGGLDVAIVGRSGVGAQYALVSGRQGDSGIDYAEHYVNLGATIWINEVLAVAARVGLLVARDSSHKKDDQGNAVEWSKTVRQIGSFLSLRAQL
jgi:hypothetical protein